jgi:hypothetical protein
MISWAKGKKKYKGHYIKTQRDRVFQLVPIKGGKVYSFESWQAAVKRGFLRIKK